jgi:hypothetical protein
MQCGSGVAREHRAAGKKASTLRPFPCAESASPRKHAEQPNLK